ncbi:hypothetical protein PAMA_018784 [Pampus argenteus]
MSAEVTTAQVLAKRQSEDAQKKRELSQKKLLSPEAQRISAVLANCISKVEIVATLPAALQLDSMSSIVDKELSRLLQAHQISLERLETLAGLKQESDGEQEGEVGETTRRTMAQLENDVKDSVRDLLRLFRERPDAFSGWRTDLVGESEYMLIKGLKQYHRHAIKKLLTSPEEEQRQVLYKQVSSSCAHDMEHIVSPEGDEVAAIIKQLDAKISDMEDMIKMKSPLRENNVVLSVPADKECQALIRTSKMKQASVQKEIDQLNVQLNNLILENKANERLIQEKNEKLEKETEHLLHNFDSDIEEKQADLEICEMDCEADEEELRKLEKAYAVLEVEYNQILEKRRLAEERRKEEMIELELKTKAAIFAQAWWRGYSTRKALKNKTKSKKAKKSKGKKTK